MCFDYVERFALLLNDLERSMKLPPRKYPAENCVGIYSPTKISTKKLPSEKTHLVETSPGISALQQLKNQTTFKI